MVKLPTRQIHLDFHNSPYIPGICSNFDADAFADTMAKAHVNSVTVFARCIHGMSYYPTKYGVQHPEMGGRDFLKEAIEALHKRGIRAPIYVTITWEQEIARLYPEWLQMYKDGTWADFGGQDAAPGKHWTLSEFIHPGYMDYIEGYLTEILEGYPVDGFFVDMVFYNRFDAGDSGWSPVAREFRKEHGIEGDDMEAHYRFEAEAQRFFTERMTGVIKKHAPEATVFYNTPTDYFIEANEGSKKRFPYQTQIEVESLPSGEWGYMHFPKVARRLMTEDKPWLSMTGRFQKMWGDFGGIKPQPALEYECFRSQAMGGANSIGDQLLPDGRLDTDAYDLIGKVYSQCEAAEPFYEGAAPCPTVGILTPGYPCGDREMREQSEEAAVLLLGELRYDCVVLDDSAELNEYQLIVLPDHVVVDDALSAKIQAYVDAGGSVIASYRSGFKRDGTNALLADWGIEQVGEAEMYPNYWMPAAAPFEGLCKQERVIYEQGLNVKADGWTTLIDRVNPYFQRDDLHYCSHFQTPSSGENSDYPACIGKGKVIYFSDPIFLDYRKNGGLFVKQCLKAAFESLIGAPIIGGLKDTVESYMLRSDDDLLLSLLHYIPYRKSISCDIIEERQSFAGQTLSFKAAIDDVFICGEAGEVALAKNDNGAFELPTEEGRLLLRVPNFFHSDS